MSSKLTYGKDQIKWRRAQVLELDAKGLTIMEIAKILQVGHSTIGSDLSYLKKQAHENLHKHITETLPHEYQRAMTGITQVLKIAWSIVDKDIDDKTRLQALALINDCNKYKMDLATGGVICTEAFNAVTTMQDKITVLQKVDERLKQTQETIEENDQTTHNGVF